MASGAATKREKIEADAAVVAKREAGEKKRGQGRGSTKTESSEPPKGKSRRKPGPDGPAGASSSVSVAGAITEDETGPIAGLLHKKASRIGVIFPPTIPKEFYAGRLPLPATVDLVKLEPAQRPARRSEDIDAMPVAAYSDSKAACLHVARRLVEDEHGSFHSLSPTSKSLLIHFFDFTAPRPVGEKRSGKRKEDVCDEATTVLMGGGHDEAALKRLREGWSSWGPDRYHWAVNLMGVELGAGKTS